MNNINTLGQCLSGIQQTILTLSIRQLEMAQEIKALKRMVMPIPADGTKQKPEDVNKQKIFFDMLMKEIQLLKQEFDNYRQMNEDGEIEGEGGEDENKNSALESIFSERNKPPAPPTPTPLPTSAPLVAPAIENDIEIIPKKKKAPPKKKVLDV